MSAALRERAIEHLERLVAFDTRNPPREIAADRGVFAWLRERLGRVADVEVIDRDEGCVSLLAQSGSPRVLFNSHVDTVPAADGWSADPLKLRMDRDRGRAIGLGACDVKGSLACMLAAVDEVTGRNGKGGTGKGGARAGQFAILVTSDEEAGKSRCVRQFTAKGRHNGFDAVVVAEPTGCRAVTSHRGLMTASAVFSGTAGHGSSALALADSAIHAAVKWGARAVEFARAREREAFGPLGGIRFNIGTIEGGVKANMIATRAAIRFGIRPPPGIDGAKVMSDLRALADDPARLEWQAGFNGPTLPAATTGVEAAKKEAEAKAKAGRLGLDVGSAADFWSEAALFSEAGATAIVFGPGDIAQAHTADEWIAVEQLAAATETYRRLLLL